MCGIAGLVGVEGQWARSMDAARTARAMASTLAHRGPDDAGVWASADGLVALAHRRLAIIDLSPRGRNPMAWDAGRLIITFNGEIYNFPDLRADLEQQGHRFKSRTDTEVILAAYDQWGVDCIHRFVGMFAFALWDSRRRRLWIARDRVGKKPVYYAEYGGALRFASELKGLLADGAFPRDVDRAALGMYLRYGYVPAPHTIFSVARKLPPAHYLLCENGRVSIERYWDPLNYIGRGVARTDDEAEAELEALLAAAVRQRLISDVPVGAFLSGGIDSSLVVSVMREQATLPVRTFTIRFDKPAFDEADDAAAVARHLGTTHEERLCDESQVLAIVGQVPEMFDEPFADSSAIPTHLVSQTARAGVTVALSGDGGDELFLGYPRYRYFSDAFRALQLPSFVRHAAARVADMLPAPRLHRVADVLRNDDEDVYARFVTWWTPGDILRLTGEPAEEAPLYRDVLTRSGARGRDVRPDLLDLVYLPDDILTKVDRASMAVGLEVRSPLLDHRVVEFALGLPLTHKRRGGTMKWLLRRLLYKRVPRELVERPKWDLVCP